MDRVRAKHIHGNAAAIVFIATMAAVVVAATMVQKYECDKTNLLRMHVWLPVFASVECVAVILNVVLMLQYIHSGNECSRHLLAVIQLPLVVYHLIWFGFGCVAIAKTSACKNSNTVWVTTAIIVAYCAGLVVWNAIFAYLIEAAAQPEEDEESVSSCDTDSE